MAWLSTSNRAPDMHHHLTHATWSQSYMENPRSIWRHCANRQTYNEILPWHGQKMFFFRCGGNHIERAGVTGVVGKVGISGFILGLMAPVVRATNAAALMIIKDFLLRAG